MRDINKSVVFFPDKTFQSWLKERSLEICFVVLSYTLSAFRMRKVRTITSKQLSVKHCSNGIVPLCTAETERVESLMRTLARTNFKSV